MDLRSIINSEEQGTARQPKNAGPPQSPINQVPNDYNARGYQSTPSRDASQYGRPPAPPPLQPPSQDFRSPAGSISYTSAQSPYQTTPPSAASGGGGQYPFPQSSVSNAAGPNSARSNSQHMSHPGSSYPPHLAPASYGLQSPSPYTPTGTTPSYQTLHQHQAHSAQSTPTPQSAGSQPPYPYRDSPLSAHSQSQHYPGQTVSQPGTPLGPPMTHSRVVSSAQVDQLNSFAHSRAQSGGSFTGVSLTYVASPTSSISAGGSRAEIPIHAHSTPPPVNQQSSRSSQRVTVSRDRSLSVSPKTRTIIHTAEGLERPHEVLNHTATKKGSIGHQESYAYPPSNGPGMPLEYSRPADPNAQILREQQMSSADQSRLHSQSTGIQLNSTTALDQGHVSTTRNATTPGHASTSNGVPAQSPASTFSPHEQPNPISRQSSFTTSHSQMGANAQGQSMMQSPSTKPQPQPIGTDKGTTPPIKTQTSSVKRERSQAPSTPDSATSHKPHKKRRYEEPPIWAQRAKNSNKAGPVPGQRNYQGPANNINRLKSEGNTRSPQPAEPRRQDTNGSAPPGRSNTLLQAAPDLGSNGPLGAWEPSFTNVIPSEELTRSVMDFLFKQVVMREDVDGPSASGTAVLEIEAKIGQLIDRNTNERLRLPVSTECVVNPNDPGIKLTFKSSMTVPQHKLLNDTLNEALKSSMLPPRKRMTYLHRRERDSFFELSQSAHMTLPASIRNTLNPRHNVKLRVTTDQKSGATLARIIKVRVADLDVYSPRTLFDWRISVNLEMNYEGDISDLVESTDSGRRGDRNKDRMSYTHQAYQIDLTQVTPSDSTALQDKEHELEVEVSTAEVRNQGQLARDRKTNQYEELIKGFVDNVRVLARIVK